jgi:hypothetical protein
MVFKDIKEDYFQTSFQPSGSLELLSVEKKKKKPRILSSTYSLMWH